MPPRLRDGHRCSCIWHRPLCGGGWRPARPRLEWPTMPKTCFTPQFTSVSAITSVTVRSCAGSGFQADEHGALADLDRMNICLPAVFVPARRLAGEGVEVPSVPGAAYPALAVHAPRSMEPSPKRAALMRAAVVHGRPSVRRSETGRPSGCPPSPTSRGPRAVRRPSRPETNSTLVHSFTRSLTRHGLAPIHHVRRHAVHAMPP